MNPMNLFKMFYGKNPKDILLNMLKQNVGLNNPMVNNLLSMAEKGDNKSIETFAGNFCQGKGVDFDKEFNTFMSNINK